MKPLDRNQFVARKLGKLNNEIIFQKGEIPTLDNNAKPHWEIAVNKNIIDFENGVNITGTGFPVFIGKGAKLQRGLINYFLDKNINELDRKISNKRIYPAIDIVNSSTRREDLLMGKEALQRVWIMRKHLSDMTPLEAMEFLKDRLERTDNNAEFLMSMNS